MRSKLYFRSGVVKMHLTLLITVFGLVAASLDDHFLDALKTMPADQQVKSQLECMDMEDDTERLVDMLTEPGMVHPGPEHFDFEWIKNYDRYTLELEDHSMPSYIIVPDDIYLHESMVDFKRRVLSLFLCCPDSHPGSHVLIVALLSQYVIPSWHNKGQIHPVWLDLKPVLECRTEMFLPFLELVIAAAWLETGDFYSDRMLSLCTFILGLGMDWDVLVQNVHKPNWIQSCIEACPMNLQRTALLWGFDLDRVTKAMGLPLDNWIRSEQFVNQSYRVLLCLQQYRAKDGHLMIGFPRFTPRKDHSEKMVSPLTAEHFDQLFESELQSFFQDEDASIYF